MSDFVCKDSRECFGKKDRWGRNTGKCHVLQQQDSYPCVFCKPMADYTNGKRYPYNPITSKSIGAEK